MIWTKRLTISWHFITENGWPVCPQGHKEVQWGEERPSVHSRTARKCFSGSLRNTSKRKTWDWWWRCIHASHRLGEQAGRHTKCVKEFSQTSTHVSISENWFMMGRMVSMELPQRRSDLFPTRMIGTLVQNMRTGSLNAVLGRKYLQTLHTSGVFLMLLSLIWAT